MSLLAPLAQAQTLPRLKLSDNQRFLATQDGKPFFYLAELDGVSVPNAYGDLPLIDKDPAKPAVTPGSDPNNAQAYDYWDHVDYIVDQANAQTYGEFLGKPKPAPPGSTPTNGWPSTTAPH